MDVVARGGERSARACGRRAAVPEAGSSGVVLTGMRSNSSSSRMQCKSGRLIGGRCCTSNGSVSLCMEGEGSWAACGPTVEEAPLFSLTSGAPGPKQLARAPPACQEAPSRSAPGNTRGPEAHLSWAINLCQRPIRARARLTSPPPPTRLHTTRTALPAAV